MIGTAMLLAGQGSWLAIAVWSIIAVLAVLLAHVVLSRAGRDDTQTARTPTSGPSATTGSPTTRHRRGRGREAGSGDRP